MTPELLPLLADPDSGEPLTLVDAEYAPDGRIERGFLVSASGGRFPIVDGIPRFVPMDDAVRESVVAFGDEWNHFNFTAFHAHWLEHTVANTFGSPEAFRGRVVVDAGAGSGAQSLWMLQAGARHVVSLDLSHAVDGVIRRNLESSGHRNYDIVQCSIDRPPLRAGAIDGIVICHNVIQHTPSVERTARALFRTVAPGGEFVFNCYPLNDQGPLRWIRFHLIYTPLRAVLSRSPRQVVHVYAHAIGALRLLPGLGTLIEKLGLSMQGDVPRRGGFLAHLRQRYRAAVLNTFDWYGTHGYQHHKRDDELRALVAELQPDATKVINADRYFQRPPPIGCALRLVR